MSKKNQHDNQYKFTWSLLAPNYWFTWLGLLFYFIVTLLPLSIIDKLGESLGQYAAKKNKKRFNIAKTNISLCFPDKKEPEIEQMVFSHFRAQFRSVLHYFIVWWRPEFLVKKRIETEGFEQIDDYKHQGKNIIILLSHSVGLEFALTALSMNYACSGIFKKLRNPVINWLVARGRLRFGEKFGGKVFAREEGLRPLVRDTRAGNILVYLADEDHGEQHSIFAPFYGIPKATLPVLGRLAKSTNAVVLPCVSCYQPEQKKYRVKLLPKIKDLPSGDNLLDSTKMNQAIQETVEICPVQYLWTLRYFQTRPEGEASVYDV